MAKKKRFVFLSKKFYNTYPASQYPEIEQKENRPYIQACVEIDLSKPINQTLVKYSTLQYFEKEIGL